MNNSHVLVLDSDSGGGPAAPDTVTFVGNATMLLRIGGITLLTDPTFVHRHERVDLGYGMSTERLVDPAIDIDDLPPVDAVLLSHFHGDHFDQVAQERLDRSLPIVTTPQARDRLHELGFRRAMGLQTWEELTLTKGDRRLTLTACPGRHGPGLTDLVLPDVMGTVLRSEDASGGRAAPVVYISGDTLVFEDLAELPRRYPELDTAFLHLGGTRVLGILVTMDGEQGVEMVRLLDPHVVVPIHYEDYDVFTSSLDDFVEAAGHAGLGDRVRLLERGQAQDLWSRTR